jgi:hypothetical protein
MRGIVGVKRFFVLALMPVLKIRSKNDVAQRVEVHVRIAMVEGPLEAEDDDVCINHFFAKS